MAGTPKRVVFVHHSVGRQLIVGADLRENLAAAGIELTDTDYNRIGAKDVNGTQIAAPSVPHDDTDVPALAATLEETPGEFVSWLQGFDLVVLKSCYPNSRLGSDAIAEAQRVELSRIARAAASRFEATLWLTPPPLAPLRTSRDAARRARDNAEWSERAMTTKGVSVFNLHRELSNADGLLREGYRRVIPFDSHPNAEGAKQAGFRLKDAIIAAANGVRI